MTKRIYFDMAQIAPTSSVKNAFIGFSNEFIDKRVSSCISQTPILFPSCQGLMQWAAENIDIRDIDIQR